MGCMGTAGASPFPPRNRLKNPPPPPPDSSSLSGCCCCWRGGLASWRAASSSSASLTRRERERRRTPQRMNWGWHGVSHVLAHARRHGRRRGWRGGTHQDGPRGVEQGESGPVQREVGRVGPGEAGGGVRDVLEVALRGGIAVGEGTQARRPGVSADGLPCGLPQERSRPSTHEGLVINWLVGGHGAQARRQPRVPPCKKAPHIV